MQLIPVQGYDRSRSINVFVGFKGITAQAKRREIRAALHSWSNGIKIGASVYASEVSGVTVSKANIKDVVKAISGVTEVTRVALETPSNTDLKITASSTELLNLGQITLNNQAD